MNEKSESVFWLGGYPRTWENYPSLPKASYETPITEPTEPTEQSEATEPAEPTPPPLTKDLPGVKNTTDLRSGQISRASTNHSSSG